MKNMLKYYKVLRNISVCNEYFGREFMLGVYLSGTGNTKHCVEKLVKLLDEKAIVLPLEDADVLEHIKINQTIILGYPTQFSNAPIMVRDFIKTHDIWQGKNVLCVTTMGGFSGDGAGCTARLLKKKGAVILGGLHIRMPDSVCDSKLLKKSLEENRKIVAKADEKIELIASEIKNGKYPKDGLTFISHMAGLLGQRLWFYGETLHYSNKLKISDACVGCGICSDNCPMNNLFVEDGKAIAGSRCTMCYRCISSCPQKAITLLGKSVVEQCRFSNYA